MIQIHPLEIVEVALTLGYTEQDLYPLPYEFLEQESAMITKKMSPKEKQFYLQKKIAINQARRQKILKEVYHQAEVLKSQLNKFNKYNPKVKQIIQQHQKYLKKSLKYNEVRSRASSRSQSQNKDNQSDRKLNSIDLGNGSPVISNRSSFSKTSQTSRNINSQVSNRSNRSNRTSSSANSLTRSKLDSVRSKQKEQQQMKKRMLLQKQRQDEIKFLKAQQNIMNKSRKVKIRSQISQKIVKENKLQMQIIRNLGNKDHLESLKFNISKHNYQRQKKLNNSISHSRKKDLDVYYVNSANKQLQRSKDYMNRYRYEQKQRNSLDWQNQYNTVKFKNLEFSHNEKQVKEKLANQRRSFQQKRINDAQLRREEELARRKLSGISQQIKREIVDKNKKSIETSESMRKKVITKHYNEKIQELSYIDNLKDKLKKGELNFGKTSDDGKQGLSSADKNRNNGPRNSVTSKNNRYSYFNTILY